MRLIDANELQKLFNETTTSLMDRIDLRSVEHLVRASIMVTQMIHDAPTIEAEPIRRGHWVDYQGNPTIVDNEGYVEGAAFCSACGGYLNGSDEYSVKGRYCPSCGAKMEDNE